MLDGLTLAVVDRLADRVSSSVSFNRIDDSFTPSFGKVTKVALNVRIPFCVARCPFCAFPGELYTNSYAKIFLQGLKDEMRLYSDMLGGEGTSVERVYLSGGTPTLLYKELGTVAENVREYFSFNGKVAMEAAPSDLKEEVLRGLVDIGVRDLSVGIQSFHEGLLARVGRPGRKEDLIKTLKRVMDCGFDYVNIDLMFSLPGQTPQMLEEDLQTATSIGVDGISTYPLMMMPYTGLGKGCAGGKVTEGSGGRVPDQDLQAEVEQYNIIIHHMNDNSYRLRTLWSFSTKPEVYEGPYEHDSFLGLGPRAWGMVNNHFTLNSPSTEDYIAALKGGRLPLFAYSMVSDFPAARLARRFYYGRISRGELEELYRDDGKLKVLVRLFRTMGLLEWEGDWLKLTDKALGYGTVATKKIAISTLSKMDEILKAG